MNLRKYSVYRNSGVEWLGEVPEHWGQQYGRRLFAQRREPALSTDIQLSATQKHGVIPQQLFMESEDQKVVLALSGLESFKHVEEGDFVISLRSFQGGIEYSEYAGCVSPAYTILRSNYKTCLKYWCFLLKSRVYVDVLQTTVNGIRDGKNISYEQFGSVCLPLPPGVLHNL